METAAASLSAISRSLGRSGRSRNGRGTAAYAFLVVGRDVARLTSLAERLHGEFDRASVVISSDPEATLRLVDREWPDLVLIDVEEVNGELFQFLRAVGLRSTAATIVLAVGSEVAATRALEAGADECLTRPYAFAELAARIRAILRRVSVGTSAFRPTNSVKLPDLAINVQSREVTYKGRRLSLSPTEFAILLSLALNHDRTVSWRELYRAVGADGIARPSLIRTHIHRLRTKLGDTTGPSALIVNHRERGYRLVSQHLNGDGC